MKIRSDLSIAFSVLWIASLFPSDRAVAEVTDDEFQRLKEQVQQLSQKVQQLEDILKTEGIL